MNRYNHRLSSFLAVIFTIIGINSAKSGELYGISKPSAEAALSFTTPGRVIAVHVRDGDRVSTGQILAEQDGTVLDARINQVRLESESTVEVEAAKAELAQREQELKKIGQAHDKGAATDLERERAALEVVISGFRVKAATEKRTMASHHLEELQAERKLLYLRSPTDGLIEKLQVEAGEAPKAMEPVLWVVDCEPLWIDVPVPLRIADKLTPESPLDLTFPDGTRSTGKVLVISSVADAASETVPVRIVMPNPEGRRAGERVGIAIQE